MIILNYILMTGWNRKIYIRAKGKSRKLILIKDDEYKEVFIITGAEGKWKNVWYAIMENW